MAAKKKGKKATAKKAKRAAPAPKARKASKGPRPVKTGKGATPQEVGNELVKLVRSGRPAEVETKLPARPERLSAGRSQNSWPAKKRQ